MERFFILTLFTACCASATLQAQDLQPFDRLGRSNITLKTELLKGGSEVVGQSVKTDYGTYSKDLASVREFAITVSVLGKDNFDMEAYALFKDHSTKALRCSKLIVTRISDTEYRFKISAEHTRERWMYADEGRVSQSGEKIIGWLARAIFKNQIIGISASSPQFEELAKNPKKLDLVVSTAN